MLYPRNQNKGQVYFLCCASQGNKAHATREQPMDTGPTIITIYYSICDSRGSDFDIIFIHISKSTEENVIKVYIFLKEMIQRIFLL